MKNKNIIYLALITGAILLVPLFVMLFNGEITWTLFDFIIAGLLIFGTGLAYQFVSTKVKGREYKVALVLILGSSFFLIWSNLAVGIIGSEDNPFNLMYFGVIIIGIIGSLLSRFQAKGMAKTAYVMAIAQILVPIIALYIGRPEITTAGELMGVIKVFAINIFFVVLFVAAGIFFQRANKKG